MSTLEREVIEKFRLLDEGARKRVLDLIERETHGAAGAHAPTFNFDAWWAQVEAARITLPPDSSGHVLAASELLAQIREERDADILVHTHDPATSKSSLHKPI
jgi:hypothetical protein